MTEGRIPDRDCITEAATADALAVARQLREDWNGADPMPLTDDYPRTAFAVRRRANIAWPETAKSFYLDVFREYLAAEDVTYRIDGAGRAYVEDQRSAS